MVSAARHDFYLVNDSDIFAGPDYLRRVMASFADPDVGMVTAFYSGRCVPDADGKISLWAKLESLTISSEFVPGAILAMQMEGGIRFALLLFRPTAPHGVGQYLCPGGSWRHDAGDSVSPRLWGKFSMVSALPQRQLSQ